jgi:hypothetical protein
MERIELMERVSVPRMSVAGPTARVTCDTWVSVQNPEPYIVRIVREPAPETTLGDVVLGALGLTGVLTLIALVLGALLAFAMIRWHHRHPPERNHLPPVSPLVPDPDAPPSSPAR